MLPIQIILIFVFVVSALKVVGRYRDKELALVSALGWLTLWITAAIVVVLPDSTFYFARLVGVARGADLVVYASLVILFFIIFRSRVEQEKLQRDITRLTRTIALSNKDKKV